LAALKQTYPGGMTNWSRIRRHADWSAGDDGAVHGSTVHASGLAVNSAAEPPKAKSRANSRRFIEASSRRGEDSVRILVDMVTAKEALERLREGNRRFASGIHSGDVFDRQARRLELTTGQAPFAIILGCSDSRVPAEIIFDQGLGDLFVIRVAGNIVAPSQVGSVEFAADRFETPLVMVLGHSRCGAVQATLEQLTQSGGRPSRNLHSIVDRIRPSVDTVLAEDPSSCLDTVLQRAIRANVRMSVDHLRHGSDLLEQLIRDGRLHVVGAEYSLETGLVDVFDE
jgi:carbonic anhydrase